VSKNKYVITNNVETLHGMSLHTIIKLIICIIGLSIMLPASIDGTPAEETLHQQIIRLSWALRLFFFLVPSLRLGMQT
jgi:hypothetical protein